MKNLLIAILLLTVYNTVAAQEKRTIRVTEGTLLQYVVYPHGQPVPVEAVLEKCSPDSVCIAWQMAAQRGRYRMGRSSLTSSRFGYWGKPVNGEDLLLNANMAVLLFSKAAWNELQQQGRTQYDGQEFRIKKSDAVYKTDGNLVRAVLLENNTRSTRIWLSADAAFPLLLRIEGNTAGPDLELTKVNETNAAALRLLYHF